MYIIQYNILPTLFTVSSLQLSIIPLVDWTKIIPATFCLLARYPRVLICGDIYGMSVTYDLLCINIDEVRAVPRMTKHVKVI